MVRMPLMYRVYKALRRGWKRMTPEAQQDVRAFVASQKTAHGYMNAGGHEDAYYGQFGDVLEAVFCPVKTLRLLGRTLVVRESMGRDTVYGKFFAFLSGERQTSPLNVHLSTLTTNAVCCVLTMQCQMGEQPDAAYVEWLQQRQDETGGFHASYTSPVPDLLSTAVALFTARLIGIPVKDATPFIMAHWLEGGGFTPTVLDDYSDVEYVFYGLLALGTTCR